MSSRKRFLVSATASLIVLAILVRLTYREPGVMDQLLLALYFGLIMVFATIFGVPLRSGIASLLPMITIAAYLVLGKVPVAWMAFLGAIVHGLIRYFFADRLAMPRPDKGFALPAVTAANASMHTATVLVSGTAYELVGGMIPLLSVDSGSLIPLAVLGLTYFGVNNLIAGVYLRLRSRSHLRSHVRELPKLMLYEVTPIISAPLIALIYMHLGGVQFTIFAFVLVLLSLITHNLDQTRQRLERRVRELDSLQSVGQALSASLKQGTIMSAVYDQVIRLMPADTFYIATYDPEADEIHFPLVVREGRSVEWPSRRTANGLTEHVLKTRNPLLVREDLHLAIERLGLEPVILEPTNFLAASWLAVPMLAGDELIGVISVQSHATPKVYDEMHQKILMTIAAQAAIAIHNAHLYASTDSALTRRIQELDLILRTTHDGILLLDRKWHVLSANRAFVELAGLPMVDLKGKPAASWPDETTPLISSIGYALDELKEDGRIIAGGEKWCRRQISMSGSPDKHVERTLVPVHGRDTEISGWLLVFRDITEEVELSRLREDMTHMLVHDLRSPLSVIMGSLETMQLGLNRNSLGEVVAMLQLAESSAERMLGLINDLLDVYRFESGEIPICPEPVPLALLFSEAKGQFVPLLEETKIKLQLDMELGLPSLLVDLDYVGRALHNLLDNAIKFTPDGGQIRLWARIEDGSAPKAMLIGVDDSGPGIPADVQGKIFEKFSHGLTSGGRREGTGLGLHYCKLVVEAHGGEIWVSNSGAQGEGSTFVMRLPVAESGADPS